MTQDNITQPKKKDKLTQNYLKRAKTSQSKPKRIKNGTKMTQTTQN